ncbi:MAG: RluA family pseudouridine synthase [Enterobacteriaceae bacterium]
MSNYKFYKRLITKSFLGKRLDVIVSFFIKKVSRSKIKKLILNNLVKIDHKTINKPSFKVKKISFIYIKLPVNKIKNKIKIYKLKLNKIYEDKYILVINKNSNLVVHPGNGNKENTLMNALLYYYPKIINVPRCGIVHRLDKDTTGLMVIAKTTDTYFKLTDLLKKRMINRKYIGIVFGNIYKDGKINKPIKRNSFNRTKMKVSDDGKESITYYKVEEIFNNFTKLKIKLYSGRTHQIRVHMLYISHPIVGDKKYYIKRYNKLIKFKRQALHSSSLEMKHPYNNFNMKWKTSLPNDIKKLIDKIKSIY